MNTRSSLTDLAAQIRHVNDRRVAAGLQPLDTEVAIREAIGMKNRLLAEARVRLREKAGRDLAGNSFTHMLVAREIEPAFGQFISGLLARP